MEASKTTALVVGADRGIAEAVCRQLAARGTPVIAGCLGSGEHYSGTNIRRLVDFDVTSDTAVRSAAAVLRDSGVRLGLLVHVAGVLGLDRFGAIDYADMRRQFEINTLGPLRVAEAFSDLLLPGSKIGIVTSRVGSLTDNGSGGMYAYRVSKAGANMVGLNLHHEFKDRGISVVMLHPGMVATALTADFPGTHHYIQPNEAALGLIARLDALQPETSGRFVHANGDVLPW